MTICIVETCDHLTALVRCTGDRSGPLDHRSSCASFSCCTAPMCYHACSTGCKAVENTISSKVKALIRAFVKPNKAGRITSECAYAAPSDRLQKGVYAFQSTASELHLCWVHREGACGSHTEFSADVSWAASKGV